MTNFIRDNTALWDDKSDANPPSNPTIQWSAGDIALSKAAHLDTQSYLRSGLLDASPTVTVSDFEIKADTDPAVGPEMDWAGYNGRWYSGVDVANAPTSRDFVTAGVRRDYSFPDGVTTSGSPTLTSASGGGFTTALIGATIAGAGIPAGTTISGVASTTSLTMSANATVTATGVRVTITTGLSQDLAYWRHRGAQSPTLGIGFTPPNGQARLQVAAEDAEPAMGTVRLRRGPSQTGNVLTLHDSTPIDRLWVDKDFYVSGNHVLGGAMVVQADATNARSLCITDNAKGPLYGFTFPGGNSVAFRCISGGNDCFLVGTDGSLRHLSSKLGFFAATAITKPTVTGSRGGNAALASLITALANLGLITDSTTA